MTIDSVVDEWYEFDMVKDDLTLSKLKSMLRAEVEKIIDEHVQRVCLSAKVNPKLIDILLGGADKELLDSRVSSRVSGGNTVQLGVSANCPSETPSEKKEVK